MLQTGPGHDTHWGQMVFPLPPVDVLPGDTLEIDARPEGRVWRWSGVIRRDAVTLHRFDARSAMDPTPTAADLPPWPDLPPVDPQPPLLPDTDRRARILVLNQRAVAAWQGGAPDTAADLLGELCVSLRPEEDDLAPALYENLGIFQLARGRPRDATHCFLRAIDGGDAPEQSMRLLIDSFLRIGQPHNAARALRHYERIHGPHPQGWSPLDVAPCCGNARRPPG